MNERMRYVVYADFLGTEQRYANPKLVERGRELLEQALNMLVVPKLKDDDMYLYVFSDTAILTCPRLYPLLAPVSDLFNHWIELQDGGLSPLSLWLRAGISYGEVLYVDHLQNSSRVRTIPFLDTSLPKAYRLESIRKGSRVFVDPAIPDSAFEDGEGLFFRWEDITGHGRHEANVAEYLWPAKSRPDSDRLAKTTRKLYGWWSEELEKKEWSRDEYYEGGLIHLDETVKLFIRTSSKFCDDDTKRDVFFSLLPDTKSPHKNVRYKWGMWFQLLKGLVEREATWTSDNHDIETAFEVLKWILCDGGFFTHFIGELKYPDYAGFKGAVERLGLHQFE